VWVLAILLALLFTAAGGAKLLSSPAMVQEFAAIGFGQWLRYLTGILEVSGAIGMLIPRLRFWAALQIAAVMVGATITNAVILHLLLDTRITVVLLVLALSLAWLHYPQAVRQAKATGRARQRRRVKPHRYLGQRRFRVRLTLIPTVHTGPSTIA